MKQDRSTYIGFFLIGLLLMGWLYYQNTNQKKLETEQGKRDSVARIQKAKDDIAKAAEQANTPAAKGPVSDSARAVDSVNNQNTERKQYGIFYSARTGTDQNIVLENDLIKATVSAKGGKISTVELKDFKTSNGTPLILFLPNDNHFGLVLNAYSTFSSTDSLYFSPVGGIVTQGDSSTITMQLNTTDPAKYMQFIYTLKKGSYLVGYKVKTVGLQNIIPPNAQEINLEWSMTTPSQEADMTKQRRASTIYYKFNGSDVDNLSTMKDDKKVLPTELSWVAFKQQFFSSILITNNKLGSPEVSDANAKDLIHVKNYSASVTIPYTHQASETFAMQFYFGPNNYKLLKSISGDGDNDMQFERLIDLGTGIFGWFGKPINRWIIIPLFNFLNQFNMNYGLVILILTLVLKALLFPIAFRTYVSSAKMRILKPEIDEVNKKFPKTEDAMKKQQGVMALYKKAGINPMAGCLPVLLQLPILTALFSFFPASIELRQQHFLWAKDLSTYDSVYTFHNFSIPLYGDHISVFALLMTLSQYLYLTANQQLMGSPAGGTDQMAKMMKWMMYLMPIMFLSVLNSYSAGLSYYYFLANLITFGQTFLARRFIDEDALHRKMQENKAKPVKQSKFQARLEQMVKDQQAAKRNQGKK